jgi:hypothetical protein
MLVRGPEPRGVLQRLVAAALGLGSGIFIFCIAAGLAGSWRTALAVAVPASALATWMFWKRPPVLIDEAACSRGLMIVAALAAVLALVQLGRLAVFMVAPERPAWSSLPASNWEVRHSCVTAYYVAAKGAGTGANVYDDSLYTAPDDDRTKVRKPLMLGPFRVDVYEYPPAFLPLPRVLLALAPDFIRFRTLWFGLMGAVVLAATLVTARFMGPAAGTRALLYSPLIWASYSTISTFQKGNVQVLVIAISMLAMAFFEQRRWAAGGALLAYATGSKLFPGLLAVDLIVRRRWRALGWTAAMGVAIVLVTLADLGWSPFAAFLKHLPGLVGGEAFPAFRNPAAIAINMSVPGTVFKLKLFGVAGASFEAAKIVGWIYTVVAIWATVVLARRTLSGEERPLAWMAILILATLRSPFLPQTYGVFPSLWLLTLLASVYVANAKTVLLTIAGWLGVSVFWPMDFPMDPRWLTLLNALPQASTIVLAVLVLRRAAAPEPSAVAPAAALAT